MDSANTWTLYGQHDGLCPSTRLSPFESKLGGHPDFFTDCLLTSAPLCSVCHSPLVLVLQIYCPSEESPYHRLLHIYSCTQRKCWSSSKSWLVLRSQSYDPTYGAGTSTTCNSNSNNQVVGGAGVAAAEQGKDGWCDGEDDWHGSEGAEEVKESGDLTLVCSATDTEATNETEPEPPKHGGADFKCNEKHVQLPYRGPAYPAGYVRVTSSTDDNFPAAQVEVREMLKRYSLENLECPVATSGNENGGTRKEGRGGKQSRVVDKSDSGGERYEKGVAKHGDAAFMKFQKELRKCSSQLLRYCWGGSPVTMTNRSLQEPVEACPHCGAERAFECQLMPQAVYYLQKGVDSTKPCLDPDSPPRPEQVVEFGTVIIYSCLESCWDRNLDQEKTKGQNLDQDGTRDQYLNQDGIRDQNLNGSSDQNLIRDRDQHKDQKLDHHLNQNGGHTHWDCNAARTVREKLLDKFRQEIIVVQFEEN